MENKFQERGTFLRTAELTLNGGEGSFACDLDRLGLLVGLSVGLLVGLSVCLRG
jgi:hypothetical protein